MASRPNPPELYKVESHDAHGGQLASGRKAVKTTTALYTIFKYLDSGLQCSRVSPRSANIERQEEQIYITPTLA
jgi:hypothetical protein